MFERFKELLWENKISDYILDKLEKWGVDMFSINLPIIGPYEQSIIYKVVQQNTSEMLINLLLQKGYKNKVVEVIDENKKYLIKLILNKENFSIETLVKENEFRKMRISSQGNDLEIQLYERNNNITFVNNYSLKKLTLEQRTTLQVFYYNLIRRCMDIIIGNETQTEQVDVKTIQEYLK